MFAFKRYQLINKSVRSLFIGINNQVLPGRQKAQCIPHSMMNRPHPYLEMQEPACPPGRVPNKRKERRWGPVAEDTPELGCEYGGCGWYAFKQAEYAHAQANLSWIEYAWGLVWLGGRIIEHEDGTVRGEYCELLALASVFSDVEAPEGVPVYLVKTEKEGWDVLKDQLNTYESFREIFGKVEEEINAD